MSSKVFTTFAALSLLFFIATVAAWILSYAAPTSQLMPTRGWTFQSRGGEIELTCFEPPVPGLLLPPGGLPPGMTPRANSAIHSTRLYPLGQFGTISDYSWQVNATIRGSGIYVSYPALTFAAALICACAAIPVVRARRRNARALHGLCPQCGYDLRASPTRCPECGNTVPPIQSELSV